MTDTARVRQDAQVCECCGKAIPARAPKRVRGPRRRWCSRTCGGRGTYRERKGYPISDAEFYKATGAA